MKEKLAKAGYTLSTALFAFLAVLFFFVLIRSFWDNVVYAYNNRIMWSFSAKGNYMGIFCGLGTYLLFMCMLIIPRIKHNLNWFMKFTHELTHTLMALLFFKKINEFVVKGKECYVNYKVGKYGIGYTPITLSPYCIPIYTFMIFPFRFAGDYQYMIFFDALIAFSYAFHLHSFIKQTRFTQPDIENCGIARSVSYLAFTHLAVASLILATPKGGVLKAFARVFFEYPMQILTDPSGWVKEIINYFSF
jgi:hypothetical protein